MPRRAIAVKSARMTKRADVHYPNDFEETDGDEIKRPALKRKALIRAGTTAPLTAKEFDGLGHEGY